MTSKARARRVADRIQEELAGLLIREVSDPRLSLVTITDVEVDRELAVANVYVVTDDDRRQDVLEGLARARGFLRSRLAARIPLRTFPELRFHWDPSEVNARRIEALLDELRRKEERSTDGS